MDNQSDVIERSSSVLSKPLLYSLILYRSLILAGFSTVISEGCPLPSGKVSKINIAVYHFKPSEVCDAM